MPEIYDAIFRAIRVRFSKLLKTYSLKTNRLNVKSFI